MSTLQNLQAELAKLNAEIAKQKALNKLQSCKVKASSMPKYFDLQQAYMAACKGI